MNNDEVEILAHELLKHTKKCKCGHSVLLIKTYRKDKVICTYCGRYVYRTDYDEFKDKLSNAMLRNNCI